MSKNVAVIGCGHWGKNLVRNFFELSSLKGVYDVSTAAADSMAEQYEGVEAYHTLEDVLGDAEVEAVVIAAPVEEHYRLGMVALAANKHIFIEKPVTSNSDEARQLLKISVTKGKVFQVGHLLEYHPAVTKLREMVEEGAIGTIKEVYSHRLNAGKVRQFENVWWSFAPHDILLLLNTVQSSPIHIGCFTSDYLGRGLEDSTITTFRFRNGCFGHIYVSWLHPFKEQRFIVVGDKGAIEFTDSRPTEKLRFYHNEYAMSEGEAVLSKGDYEVIDFPQLEPLKEECKSFLECIETGKSPISSGYEGLRVIEVLEQAMEAAQRI